MQNADELRAAQKAQWSGVASAWSKWDGWFDAQTRSLVEWFASNAKPGARVLDLACGPGQPARTIAKAVGSKGHVIATDISPEMLAVAKAIIAKEGHDNIELREMGAENITFPDASFDLVSCRFGLMFCPEPEKAASEIHRVLVPGGRFAVCVWDEPAKNPFFTAIGRPLVELGLAPPPDPKAPGVFRLGPPGELERVLRAGGFTDVKTESRPMTVEYESLDQYWQVQTDLAAPLRVAIAKLSPPEVAKLRETVLGALGPYIVDGRVRLQATPLVASGTK